MTKQKHYGRKTFDHDTFEQNAWDRSVPFARNADHGEDGNSDPNESVVRTARRNVPKTAGKDRRPLSPMRNSGETLSEAQSGRSVQGKPTTVSIPASPKEEAGSPQARMSEVHRPRRTFHMTMSNEWNHSPFSAP